MRSTTMKNWQVNLRGRIRLSRQALLKSRLANEIADAVIGTATMTLTSGLAVIVVMVLITIPRQSDTADAAVETASFMI